MEASLVKFFSDNPGASSNFHAAVSHILHVATMRNNDSEGMGLADVRQGIAEAVAAIIDASGPDSTSWPYVKEFTLYDAYLVYRKEAGILSEYDLVRPGLSEHNFSNLASYFDHYQRVHEVKKALEGTAGALEKECTKCHNMKPKSAFKRGGVCNSCRAKIYRANVANRNNTEV